MWIKISHLILRYRFFFLIFFSVITASMGYLAQFAELSYDFSSAVPLQDPDRQFYEAFKKKFGDDGTILAIGFQGEDIYQLGNMQAMQSLADSLGKLKGVMQVLSLPQLRYLHRDTVAKRFEVKPIFPPYLARSQKELDSLVAFAQNQRVYDQVLFNAQNKALALILSIDRAAIESARRQSLMEEIQALGAKFEAQTNIAPHYVGIPFVRSIIAGKVASELRQLLILSGISTAIILFAFFRSFISVLFPMIIIGIVVIWSVGFLVVFGFKITILTGLLPPILVVIGIPNCVYLLNKYHQEYLLHQNQARALGRIIRKIGIVAFMTNATTAIGFAVFILMENQNLREFGIISSLSIMVTYLASIILLPIFYSLIPPPTPRQLAHLERRPLNWMLDFLDFLVFKRRPLTYAIVLGMTIVFLVGFWQLRPLSYMVDNLPEDSAPKQDMRFFEKHFTGIMPLEIVVDTKRRKGVMQQNTLKQIDRFEASLAEVAPIAPPLSLLSLIKASRQAFYGQNAEFYGLPNNREAPFLLRYMENSQDTSQKAYLATLVDSLGQSMRISLKVADIGSYRLDSLIEQVVKPKIKQSFKDPRFEVKVTGTTLIFLRGNDYLVDSLKSSLLLAIGLIAVLMAVLFGSFRMIVISIVCNLLPLLITAGLMGFFGVALKPSTVLVFSIAFGIAIDDSIHLLARFRQEWFATQGNLTEAVRLSLRETGSGMFYTSIVLFFGFIVFIYSSFEGTVALGALTSVTLLCAMLANLVLLPSLMINFGPRQYKKLQTQLIEYYHEDAIYEDDDEEIDLQLIKVDKNSSV